MNCGSKEIAGLATIMGKVAKGAVFRLSGFRLSNALADDRNTIRRYQEAPCRKHNCGLDLNGEDHALREPQ